MASEKTNDSQIRQRLLGNLRQDAATDDGIVVEELGICQGAVRVDVALVNGTLHGFEIKSDKDTLKRLGRQVAFYNRVLERATLVVGQAHLDDALGFVPPWWGIQVARWSGDDLILEPLRATLPNPSIDPMGLVELLWRDEVLKELDARHEAQGLRSKSRIVLWSRLAELVPVEELCQVVRNTLKARTGWRSEHPRE